MAWAWLPDEKVRTPRRRSSGLSFESALKAPRNLKAPARWKFSHLKNTDPPVFRSMVVEVRTGVRWAWPLIRCAAASMSARTTGGADMKPGYLGDVAELETLILER